ncbi:conserved protein of unknown function [Sterolibacterium denitrificans]|uniref:Uncharacterized protein n=2 Tax=Sterolibacterium denitrificans TaxID=157592 RepID=A0A656ZA01_9PROT|nr:flagellar hook-length control protein FliK [Sterolibacterium denitrificans]KYC29296.1 hypothetical protein ACY05_01800 [Sterolibacterium denitrificans]SMB30547.1 conserved protein of unknown function [Sterolibacterium denitrificans]
MALIPSDAGLRLRLENELLPQQARPVTPVKEITADLPRLQAGQNFTAQIRDVLPQNTYLALVAGKQVTLSLPSSAKSGDVLELVVVEQTPKSIVAKLADPQSAAAQQAGANQNPPQTTWSNAARMLRTLLVAEGESPKAAPLNRGEPLLARPTGNGAELAPVLGRAVSQSGLFYEAHQAQWVAGKLPLSQLRQEPQGQQPAGASPLPLPADAAAPTPAQTAGGAGTQTATAQQALGNNVLQGLLLYQANQQQAAGSQAAEQPPGTAAEAAQAGSRQQAATANAAQPQHAAGLVRQDAGEAARPAVALPQLANLPTMPDELRALVQQQLDAAGSQRLLWHGEVWPGQELDWRVEWQGDEHAGGSEEDNEPWQTHLRLTTPRLGRLEAALHLGPAGVRLDLAAAEAGSAAALRAAVDDLAQALAAAGVPLRGFLVRQSTAEDADAP